MNPDAERPSRARLALFAFGDFGFNLYWQSVMLFLLFYYTETIGLGIGAAATTFAIASVWDGIIGFAIGVAGDRSGRAAEYRRALIWGAIPLGLSFILAYLPFGDGGTATLVLLFVAHLLFRTFYALVNVPYLAMSARISAASDDRAMVAGLRMISGTLAAIIVSIGTLPIGAWVVGPSGDPYVGAAIVFAGVGSALLIVVGLTYRDSTAVAPPRQLPLKYLFPALARNRSFITLAIAMVAMIAAVTMVGKSVLYYFKYFIGDEEAGRLALAEMMAVGLIAVPFWMLVARLAGIRAVWVACITACIALLIWFTFADLHRAAAMQMFLVALQAAIIGLNFALWTMLPDTIDYGEAATGRRVEATVYGLAGLLQRISIGVATGVLGWSFHAAGFAANTKMGEDTLADIRGVMSLAPILLFAASGLAIAMLPRRIAGP